MPRGRRTSEVRQARIDLGKSLSVYINDKKLATADEAAAVCQVLPGTLRRWLSGNRVMSNRHALSLLCWIDFEAWLARQYEWAVKSLTVGFTKQNLYHHRDSCDACLRGHSSTTMRQLRIDYGVTEGWASMARDQLKCHCNPARRNPGHLPNCPARQRTNTLGLPLVESPKPEFPVPPMPCLVDATKETPYRGPRSLTGAIEVKLRDAKHEKQRLQEQLNQLDQQRHETRERYEASKARIAALTEVLRVMEDEDDGEVARG